MKDVLSKKHPSSDPKLLRMLAEVLVDLEEERFLLIEDPLHEYIGRLNLQIEGGHHFLDRFEAGYAALLDELEKSIHS